MEGAHSSYLDAGITPRVSWLTNWSDKGATIENRGLSGVSAGGRMAATFGESEGVGVGVGVGEGEDAELLQIWQ